MRQIENCGSFSKPGKVLTYTILDLAQKQLLIKLISSV